MTEHERTILRRLIDERLRARDGIAADGIRHGAENAYKRHGCRCADCRTASRQARARRRANDRPYRYRQAA